MGAFSTKNTAIKPAKIKLRLATEEAPPLERRYNKASGIKTERADYLLRQ